LQRALRTNSLENAMNRKTLIAVVVASAFAAPLAASAADNDRTQAAPGKIEQAPASSASGRTSGSAALFDRLDRNKDGFVSRDEARDATELQGRFAELDTDNDGKISRSEMRGLDNDRRGAAGSSK
jgi:hypothetical protein